MQKPSNNTAITLPANVLNNGMKLYVTAVTWYGEQSVPKLVIMK